MKCCVGVDLGSTTTKAVVLDDQGRTLGRGITNSRSNYDVACHVARSEALLDARFRLFEQALGRERELGLEAGALLAELRRAFRLEQHLRQLDELEETCTINVEALPGGAALRGVLAELFARMRAEAPALFAEGAQRRSDFFRDLSGARFAQLAKAEGCRGQACFEELLGVFDKSILAVENRAADVHLHATIERAAERVLAARALDDRMSAVLRRSMRAAIGLELIEAVTVGTGYGRARLPFPKEFIRSEILCHGLGAHATFPGTRTVLDIGGQDTKAIQVDAHGIVTSFQMNDRCAAGCGRYLGYIADEMNLGLHELGPLAMSAKKTVRISSTCTVFAGAELRDRLAMGQRREDILAGLHRAIMLRAVSLLARSGGVHAEFTFTGGVARNEAAVRALRGLASESWGIQAINISPESIYTGALGAALFAHRAAGEGDAAVASASEALAGCAAGSAEERPCS